MKKILAILLAGMMTATVFAGCGGGGNTESGGSGSDTQSSSDDATYECRRCRETMMGVGVDKVFGTQEECLQALLCS